MSAHDGCRESAEFVSAHEKNRASWNAATAQHLSHRPDLHSRYAVHRRNNLFAEDMELLGPAARRKAVLHLQCNDGQDTVSVALHMGPAMVVGVDISDVAVAAAEALWGTVVDENRSSVALPHVSFARSDIFEYCERAVPESEFDVAYTSYGALCWVSDLARWAHGISRVLRPGGRLVVVEFHPLMTALNPDTYRLESAMIGSAPSATDGVGDYVDPQSRWPNPHPATEYAHGTGDVISALLSAGMHIDHFKEYAHVNAYQALANMRCASEHDANGPTARYVWSAPPGLPHQIPLMYSVVASKALGAGG